MIQFAFPYSVGVYVPPVYRIVITYILLIFGIHLGFLGRRSSKYKAINMLGLILNILTLIVYTVGILSAISDIF